jgi:small subunit ribosomal protein S15
MRRGREKGKSHSTRPVNINEALVSQHDPDTIKKIIEDLARKGTPPSMIGVILRDQYGVPFVKHVLGKSMKEILEDLKLKPEIPEELSNLIKRANNVIEHLKEHPKDYRAKRGLEEIISKINRLAKYYKREGVLDQNWRHEITIPK